MKDVKYRFKIAKGFWVFADKGDIKHTIRMVGTPHHYDTRQAHIIEGLLIKWGVNHEIVKVTSTTTVEEKVVDEIEPEVGE